MQAIARILTKKSPQGHKSEQGHTISLGDQANGDPDQGDPRVAKRFWRYQSDLWGISGRSLVQPWKRAHSLHSHKEETNKGANPNWCALPSALEKSKEMIFSQRVWLDNEIIFLLELEAWKTDSQGGNHVGRHTGYSSETLKMKFS